jgi:NLI interacting factor-like phosphatase
VKDLTVLLNNRELADIVIIDNKIESYASNLENGIPITDYLGQQDDEMLPILQRYLINMRDADDVRKVILRDFFLENLKEMRGIENDDSDQICNRSSEQAGSRFDSEIIKDCVLRSRESNKRNQSKVPYTNTLCIPKHNYRS